jgi:hypothetical protein
MVSAKILEANGKQTFAVLENDGLKAELFLLRGGEMISLVNKKTGVQIIRQAEGFQRAYDRIIKDSPTYQDDYNSDFTTGGWFEMFPHASRTVDNDATGYCVHGDLRYHPMTAEITRQTATEAVVRLVARGTRLEYTLIKTYTITTGPMVRVTEEAVNPTGKKLPLIWGQHPTLGTPFIEGCEIEIPAATIHGEDGRAPQKYPVWYGEDIRATLPPQDKTKFRMLFLTDLKEGWYAIHNKALKTSLRMEWDHHTFPVVWYWNSRGGDAKLHDSFALEFVSGFPHNLNPERFIWGPSANTWYAFGFQ